MTAPYIMVRDAFDLSDAQFLSKVAMLRPDHHLFPEGCRGATPEGLRKDTASRACRCFDVKHGQHGRQNINQSGRRLDAMLLSEQITTSGQQVSDLMLMQSAMNTATRRNVAVIRKAESRISMGIRSVGCAQDHIEVRRAFT